MWNESEIQLKAALTSQQCGATWSSTPCVTDASAEAAGANSALPADVKKIENCHAAIALLIASFSQNKQLTSVIKRSRTTEWPGGRPWDVYDKLQRRFKRFDKAGRQQRMAQMAAITMGRRSRQPKRFSRATQTIFIRFVQKNETNNSYLFLLLIELADFFWFLCLI